MFFNVYLCLPLQNRALSVGKLTSNFYLCHWLSLGLDKKNNYPMPTSEGYVGSYKEFCKLFLGQEHAQSCPTLCDPGNCSPLGSFVHGIFQAGILEWVGCHFLLQGYLPNQGIKPASPLSPALAGGFFYHCATRESPILGQSISLMSHGLV